MIAKMKPKLLSHVRESDGAGDSVVSVDRLFQKSSDVLAIHRQKLQIGGLLQRGVLAPDRVELANIVFDIAGRVPVARLDFIFFRIDIFFTTRDRLMFEQLETVIDSVIR